MHHHIHRLPSSSFPSQRIFAILFPQNLFARKKRKKRKKERKERKKERFLFCPTCLVPQSINPTEILKLYIYIFSFAVELLDTYILFFSPSRFEAFFLHESLRSFIYLFRK